jgi:hypothetical protein
MVLAAAFGGQGHTPPTTANAASPAPVVRSAGAVPGTSGVPVCGGHCGTERWVVKTLSDAGAAAVSLTAVPKSVSELISLTAPDTNSDTERISPAEKQAFTVHARLVGYKQEVEDHDFHIVLQDLNTNDTMIVEIPDPQCDGVCNSIVRGQIQQVRADFSNELASPPAPQFVVLDDPQPIVDVTGVGFFDFAHGQTGLAENCLELHPVIAFQFPAAPGGGKFTAKHDASREPKTDKNSHKCIPRSHS